MFNMLLLGQSLLAREGTHPKEERTMKTIVALLLTLVVADQARAQTAQVAQAADITNTEIQAAVQKTASRPVSDQQLRLVSIKGEYNVGAGVVHRAKTADGEAGGAFTHSQITEVYYIISGNGTLVTGGTLEDAKDGAANASKRGAHVLGIGRGLQVGEPMGVADGGAAARDGRRAGSSIGLMGEERRDRGRAGGGSITPMRPPQADDARSPLPTPLS
jgi:mannose-6-phosphate isomerase-like protein (cupin superfamily)